MKKVLILILSILFAVCLLASCGGDETPSSSSSAPSSTGSSAQGGGSTDVQVPAGEGDYQYNMSDYVTLPSYNDYSVGVELDDVQRQIDNFIMSKAVKSKRLKCVVGDVVTVSYVGYMLDESNDVLLDEEGRAVTFDENDSYGVFLGAGLSISEFETGIVGMSIGELKEVYATFPKDYFAEDLAGKTVMFEIALMSIFDTPIYGDSFVEKYTEYKTAKEFEASVKSSIAFSKLIDYIKENAVFASYPEREYNDLAAELLAMEDDFENKYSMTLDEYILRNYNMTREEYIKQTLKTDMVYYAIAQAEGIAVTEEQLKEETGRLLAYYKDYYMGLGASSAVAMQRAKELVDDLGYSYVYENVLFELVDKCIAGAIKISERAATYKSISTVLAEREKLEEGSSFGNLCPSLDLEIFDELGASGSIIDPVRNVGKLTVINFWGTWCPYCLVELPYFDRVATEYKDTLTVFAVHSTNGYGTAAQYVENNFASSDMIFLKDYPKDKNDPYSTDMYYNLLGGAGYYPYTVILDENGLIVYKKVGAMTYEELVEAIESNLPLDRVYGPFGLTDEDKENMGDIIGDLEDKLDGISGGSESQNTESKEE